MFLLLAAVLVGAAIVWTGARLATAISAAGGDREQTRLLQLLTLFGPALAEGGDDPRRFLTWAPLAQLARELFPKEFAALDKAAGRRFPIDREAVQAAHARWTSDWLAWERTHDAEYKLKAMAAQEAAEPPATVRARLDAIEKEKLDLYQRRYEEYVRVGKALQALSL